MEYIKADQCITISRACPSGHDSFLGINKLLNSTLPEFTLFEKGVTIVFVPVSRARQAIATVIGNDMHNMFFFPECIIEYFISKARS